MKKRIPEQYDFNVTQIIDAMYAATGFRFPIIISGRIIEIPDSLTPAQLNAIKAAVVPLLTSIPDVTI